MEFFFDSDVIKLICETLTSAFQNRYRKTQRQRGDRENTPEREEAKRVSLRQRQ